MYLGYNPNALLYKPYGRVEKEKTRSGLHSLVVRVGYPQAQAVHLNTDQLLLTSYVVDMKNNRKYTYYQTVYIPLPTLLDMPNTYHHTPTIKCKNLNFQFSSSNYCDKFVWTGEAVDIDNTAKNYNRQQRLDQSIWKTMYIFLVRIKTKFTYH